MKNLYLYLLVLLSISTAHSQQYTWVQKQSAPAFARYSAASFTINGRGYFTTGADLSLSQIYDDTWEYNPTTNTWTQKANFPAGARYGAAAFSIGNFGYVGTGWAPAPTNDFYKFDPAANTWSAISPFAGSARYTAIGFSINNKGYVGFGFSPLQKDMYEYDPIADSWTPMTLFPGSPRQSASVFVLNNKAFICCGDDGISPLNETWEFNPSTNSWLQKASFPGNARYAATSFSMNGLGVIGNGSDYTTAYIDYYIYNEANDSWCSIPSMPGAARQGANGFVIGSNGYVSCGRNMSSQYYNDIWELQLKSAVINYQQIVCSLFSFSAVIPAGATSQTWYFGDGTSSNLPSPTHNFNGNGSFNVSLVINYGCTSDSIVQQINTGPGASATYNLVVDTCNLTVQVINQSFTGFTYYWSFGDGATSTQINPSHTYTSSGTYTVALIISDDCGIDTVPSIVNFPNVSQPTAQFNTLIDSCALNVSFTNTSVAAVNSSWDFGDGNFSNVVNPIHNYASPGTYTITLIVQNSCGTDTLSQTISITSGSFPVSSFSASIDSCTSTVTLNNSSIGATSYLWDFGNFTGSSQTNPVTVYDASGIYIITLIAQNACGSDTFSLPVTIPVVQLPNANFTINLDTCTRTITTINNSSQGIYQWNFGDGTTSTLNNQTHTYLNAGTYTITLIAQNACGTDSISNTYFIPDGSPQASFNITLDTCLLSLITTNTSTTGIYIWNFGDGITSTIASPTHTYATTGNYSISLTVVNSCGSDSAFQNITLNQATAPNSSFTYTLDSCAQTVAFSNTSLATNYLWLFGDSTTSINVNAVHSYTNPGNYTVMLVAFNSCGDSAISTQNITITSGNNPVAAFTVSLDTCTSTITTNNSSIGNTYLWDFGDGDSSSLINPVHTYNNQGSFTITLIASNVCGSDTNQTSYSIPAPTAPQAVFTIVLDTCLQSITTNNTSTGNTFLWNFGDSTTSSLANPTHIYASPGIYTITLISQNSCGTDSMAAVYTIPSSNAPTAGFTYTADTCSGTISFINSSNANTYLWDFGDTSGSTLINPVHNYISAGVYSVTLIATNSCGIDSITQLVSLNPSVLPSAAFTASLDTCLQLLTFTNNSTSATSYVWNFGDSSTSTQTNPFHMYLSNGTYNVTLISQNSCGSDTFQTSFLIPTNNASAANFNITVDTCLLQITTNNNSNGNTYIWDFGDNTGSTLVNPTHTYSASGTYLITLISLNNCGYDTTSIPVTLTNGNAQAVFSLAIDTCTLSITTTNSSTGNNFQWSFGDGNGSAQFSPAHTYSASGIFTVTLLVQNTCGTDSSSQQIVLPSVLLPASAFTASLDTCSQTITLSNNSQFSTGFIWNFGDNTTDTAFNVVHTYSTSGNYPVTLYSANACGTDSITNNYFIPTGNTPQASFSLILDTCSHTITTNNTSNGTTFIWQFGDSTSSTSFNEVHTYAASGVYTVTLISQNDCGSDSSSININISTGIAAVASFSLNIDTCSLTISTNNTSTATSYIWNFGDNNGSTGVNSTHTYATAGTYTITLQAINSCRSDSISQTITIPALTTPSASFNFTIDTCSQTINITNTSIDATTYQWDFGDGGLSGVSNPSHTYLSNGTYTITLLAGNTCSSNSSSQTINIPDGSIPDASFLTTIDTCARTISFNSAGASTNNYTWNFGDGNTSSQIDPIHYFLYPISYTVTLNSQNNCGTDSSSIIIDLTSSRIITASYTASYDTCTNTLLLNGTSGGTENNWYINNQLYSSLVNTGISFQSDATVNLLYIASNACSIDSITAQFNITYIEQPDINVSYTFDSCLNTLQLMNNSNHFKSILWDFGDGQTSSAPNPTHSYSTPGNYIVSVQLFTECDTLTDNFNIEVNISGNQLVIPNLFTPNGDGQNDYLKITNTQDCINYTMLVYNRWGSLLFEEDITGNGWNGKQGEKECPDGTYFCVVRNENMSFSSTVLLNR